MSKYFSKKELACKCGCGKSDISEELLSKLDDLREVFGRPIVLSSACRCVAHNKSSGGSPDSSHMKGLAADIRCIDSGTRLILVSQLLKLGFDRVGIAKDFIHVDVDKDKPKCIYLY